MSLQQKKADFFKRTIYNKATLQPLSLVEKVSVWERYEEAKKERNKMKKMNAPLFEKLEKLNLKPKTNAHTTSAPKKKVPLPFKLWSYFCKLPQYKSLTQKQKSEQYRNMTPDEKLALENEMKEKEDEKEDEEDMDGEVVAVSVLAVEEILSRQDAPTAVFELELAIALSLGVTSRGK
jgi:hypothetical protein